MKSAGQAGGLETHEAVLAAARSQSARDSLLFLGVSLSFQPPSTGDPTHIMGSSLLSSEFSYLNAKFSPKHPHKNTQDGLQINTWAL